MKICSRCILPETFPGAALGPDGTCFHCRKAAEKNTRLPEEKKRYERKFLDLIDEVRAGSSGRSYDVLMAYSGGKDSTYTMHLLAGKYGLRVLALSFDNGFLSPAAVRNISTVTDRLGVDHLLFKPRWDLLKKIFTTAASQELYARKTLERASTICTSCIGLVKALCLKTAVEKEVPLVGFGWSPGQAPMESSIMKTNPSLMRMAQEAVRRPLRGIAGDAVEAYFLSEKQFADPVKFPWNVHPMAWEYYNEGMILDEISKLGWNPPGDTDSNSTNCLLNAYANDLHVRRYGFHPYVWEIANMVRDGVMSREEGFEKIYGAQDLRLIAAAREKLGV
jgi:hypothetical protein